MQGDVFAAFKPLTPLERFKSALEIYKEMITEAALQGYTRDQAIEILKVYMLADIKSN